MRREFPDRIRLEIVQRAMNERDQVVCEGCGLILASKRYDIDHIVPEGLLVDKTAKLTAKDGQLLGVQCCHRGGRNKTADDVGRIAKAKRQRARHVGAKQPTAFRKPAGMKFNWKRGRYIREAGP